MIRVYILTIFLTINLFAFSDADLDGVDDRLDKCPNSDILDLVDKYGCSKKQKLTQSSNSGFFELGFESDFNSINDKQNFINLSFGYKIDNYSILITNNLYNYNNQNRDDISILFGYTKSYSKLDLTYAIGISIFANSQKKANYYIDIFGSYNINSDNSINFATSYTINSKNSKLEQNYIFASIGFLHNIDQKQSISSYINYQSSSYIGDKSNFWISFNYNYYLTNNYYLSFKYNRYINSNWYNNSINVSVGVNFE